MFQRRGSMTNEDKMKLVVSQELGITQHELSSTSDIISDYGADPEDMRALMRATEYMFHIKISYENWARMRTIREMVHLVDVYLEIKQIEM